MSSDQTTGIALPAEQLIAALNPTVIERVDVPPRAVCYALPPPLYCEGEIGKWLGCKLGGADRTYLHQARALELIAAGENVVVSTGTASGKSLIFMAPALHEVVTGCGSILVFYPQKSLGGDQLTRWQEELAALGLDPELVGEITGDVKMIERERVLERARIILATPDALHAWMMRMLSVDAVRDFLTNLRFVVIDEAHALEAVFGTQFAYFFRRLRAARLRLNPHGPEPQVIAATATLLEPRAHLQALTGMSFVSVCESDNGSPSYGVTLLHIDGPEQGGPAEKAAAAILERLAQDMPAGVAAIGFADSRQGVERIVDRIRRDDVLPYRGGYNPEDRRSIEQALRAQRLRAVMSTSACELGIDIPQFAFGINVGVPATRKSLRQRSGRIGRSQPGTFAISAPSAAFAKLGSSLREASTGAVEPSPLYLENVFIQFQQACCYLAEAGCEDKAPELDPTLAWPKGFAEALLMAQPGASRPAMLDEIARAGFDSPHHAFPLRSMPGVSFQLLHAKTGDLIGSIDHEKALREAYPGGTYRHLGRAYRVVEWRSSTYQHAIRLQPQKQAHSTQPMVSFKVNASIEAAELIEHHLLASEQGCLAEVQLRVAEAVEGLRLGRTGLLYKDLRQKDPRLTRKQREYATTGVLLRNNAPWFAGPDEHQVGARKAVARALETILCREYGVSSGDLRSAHTGISLHSAAGPRKIDDAIVLFDTIAGGLRLSAPVFAAFANFLARLERGAELAGIEALLSADTVDQLRRWHDSLQPSPGTRSASPMIEGRLLIFAPGSKVAIRIRGELVERQLLEPQMMAFDDAEQIMYRYDNGQGGGGWVPHHQIQPIGDEWQRATWDPATNAIWPVDVG